MRRWIAIVVTVTLILVAAIEGSRWWTGRAPYSAGDLAARADLRIVDQVTAEAALGPHSVPTIAEGQQLFLGHVTWRRPAHEEGAVYMMVLHNRTHRPPAMMFGKEGTNLASNSALSEAADRYPWLAGADGVHTADGGFIPIEAIALYSLEAEELTFAAVLVPADANLGGRVPRAAAPAQASDLTIALVQVNGHGRATWAQRLLN
ncbi:hypothetical protein ACGFJ7_41540 [Actinoplanes sp. NPDC048988]|uniref:hypothetical protein n=1 Tax=Actinoplanes sp. NPDC048988 TaxID=3363901 RepID=UPI003720EC3E